ncbi:hypothetical protein BJ741DRAFT_604299 [Chytriomyces cf. hyalinus JEL632]|nr:hypothetical protein BJ741DRAFT_604299 [Chytriomyces cf. hyalinus JEL632]
MGFCEISGARTAACQSLKCHGDSGCATGLMCLRIKRLPECKGGNKGGNDSDEGDDDEDGTDGEQITQEEPQVARSVSAGIPSASAESPAPASPPMVPPVEVVSESFSSIGVQHLPGVQLPPGVQMPPGVQLPPGANLLPVPAAATTTSSHFFVPSPTIQGVFIDNGAHKNTGDVTGSGSNAATSISPWLIGLSVVGLVAVLAVGLLTAHIRRRHCPQEKKAAHAIHDHIGNNPDHSDTNTPPALRVLRRGGAFQLPAMTMAQPAFYYKDDYFDDDSVVGDEDASVYSVNTLEMMAWAGRLGPFAPAVLAPTEAPNSPLPPHPPLARQLQQQQQQEGSTGRK